MPQSDEVGNRSCCLPHNRLEKGYVFSERQRFPNLLFVAINALKLLFAEAFATAQFWSNGDHACLGFAETHIVACP